MSLVSIRTAVQMQLPGRQGEKAGMPGLSWREELTHPRSMLPGQLHSCVLGLDIFTIPSLCIAQLY